MKANYLLLTMAVLLAVGCGETDRLHDMQDKTKQMGDTTQHMDKTTTELSDKMGDMTDTMSNLSDTTRQGGAVDLRNKFLQQMSEKQDVGAKVASAALYFVSFEYQLWSGVAEDRTEHRRQELLFDAVHEFLGEVREFMPQGGQPNPLAQPGESDGPKSQVNREACLNALSASMGWTNRKQTEAVAKHLSPKEISMYTLFADALKAGQDMNAGKSSSDSLTPYQHEVIANKPIVLQILKNRLNFMPMFIMSELMQYSNLSDLTGAKADVNQRASSENAWNELLQGHVGTSIDQAFSALSIWTKTNAKAGMMAYGARAANWQIQIDQMDEPGIERLSGFMQEFEDTRALLKSLKLPTKIDPRVKAFASGMHYSTKGKGTASVNAARTNFVGLLNRLKKDVN